MRRGITWTAILFQIRAAATEKRGRRHVGRVGGTTSADVEAERRRRRAYFCELRVVKSAWIAFDKT